MEFKSWLLNIGKSERSAKSYSGAISGVISDWAKEAKLVDETLLEVTSPKQLQDIVLKITKLEIFLARNSKGKGMYSAALSAYMDYLKDYSSEDLEDDLDRIISDPQIQETEKTTLINTRLGQGKFRRGLIDYWKGCALTGFPDTRFLVASHIKPWKASKNQERLDAFNGLLLLPNLDKVFDLGYISFQPSGQILVSPELEFAEVLGVEDSMKIQLNPRHQKYMAYHRDEKFKH